jgi:DNA invertase Pin-like site-specific DNA recombinase
MKVGYARTSTLDQSAGFEAQQRELSTAGCEKVFKEQVSSVGQREQLETALDFIRDGDTLVVCKLDRLARSTQHPLNIADRVRGKRAHLQILNLGRDTSTATGKLLLTVIGAIGQFEREMMLERQREGIAKRRRMENTKDGSPQRGLRPLRSPPSSGRASARRTSPNGWASAERAYIESWALPNSRLRRGRRRGAR